MQIKKKAVYILLLLVLVSVGVLVYVLDWGKQQSKESQYGGVHTRKTEPNTMARSEIRGKDRNLKESQYNGVHARESEHNTKVRSEIRGKDRNLLDSQGINTSLSSAYDENTPLIEILCKIRELDGTIKPLKVRSLNIITTDGKNGGSYGVKGLGFRTELAYEPGSICKLLYGEEYRVTATYKPNDESRYIFAKDSKTSFRTPESLRPGEIYQIDLVVVDRIKEQKLREEKAALKEEAKAKSLRVTLHEPPKYSFPGIWNIFYHDGTKMYVFRKIQDGDYVLRGPKKLGGDLLVFYAGIEQGIEQNISWLYLSGLKKRDIDFPEDADWSTQLSNLIAIQLRIGGPGAATAARDFKIVSFYLNKEAKIPLFWSPLVPDPDKKTENIQTPEILNLKILPGTYDARLRRKESTSSKVAIGTTEIIGQPEKTATVEKAYTVSEVAIGTMEITDQPKKTYTVVIP